jgi:membrane fusion protein (multidrug efflux system)
MEAFAEKFGETLMSAEPKSRNRKRILIWAIVAVVVVAVAGGLFLWKSKNAAAATKTDQKKNGNGKEKTPVPVSVASAAVAPISSYTSSTANLLAENEVKVLAEADGRIAQLLVDEGTRVSRGQVLAAINPEDARIAMTKAQVRTTNARAAYNRAREMHDKQLISQGDFDKTMMEKEVAESELAEAEWRLGKTTIRAPFSGVVTQRKVTLGQHVRPGEELFTVTDFDPLVANIYLPEKDVFGLTPGRQVRITLKAAQEVQFPGKIRYISPVVDTSSGTVKVTVEAVQPPVTVRPGGFVTIDIVRETRENALVIPREAVLRELQAAHVFVAEGDVAKKRSVALGLEEGGRVEVHSGLKAGEKVVVSGQGGLRDGAKIKILG